MSHSKFQIERLLRRAMLKSALYSARIEGNKLTFAEIEEDLEIYEQKLAEESLLPKRAEILAIIREHQMVTFDQIKRRFLSIPSRTLHNDLQDLIKKGLIRKRGATKASVYVPEKM